MYCSGRSLIESGKEAHHAEESIRDFGVTMDLANLVQFVTDCRWEGGCSQRKGGTDTDREEDDE